MGNVVFAIIIQTGRYGELFGSILICGRIHMWCSGGYLRQQLQSERQANWARGRKVKPDQDPAYRSTGHPYVCSIDQLSSAVSQHASVPRYRRSTARKLEQRRYLFVWMFFLLIIGLHCSGNCIFITVFLITSQLYWPKLQRWSESINEHI